MPITFSFGSSVDVSVYVRKLREIFYSEGAYRGGKRMHFGIRQTRFLIARMLGRDSWADLTRNITAVSVPSEHTADLESLISWCARNLEIAGGFETDTAEYLVRELFRCELPYNQKKSESEAELYSLIPDHLLEEFTRHNVPDYEILHAMRSANFENHLQRAALRIAMDGRAKFISAIYNAHNQTPYDVAMTFPSNVLGAHELYRRGTFEHRNSMVSRVLIEPLDDDMCFNEYLRTPLRSEQTSNWDANISRLRQAQENYPDFPEDVSQTISRWIRFRPEIKVSQANELERARGKRIFAFLSLLACRVTLRTMESLGSWNWWELQKMRQGRLLHLSFYRDYPKFSGHRLRLGLWDALPDLTEEFEERIAEFSKVTTLSKPACCLAAIAGFDPRHRALNTRLSRVLDLMNQSELTARLEDPFKVAIEIMQSSRNSISSGTHKKRERIIAEATISAGVAITDASWRNKLPLFGLGMT